jgi:F0F1-type ATP synthase delta subunit
MEKGIEELSKDLLNSIYSAIVLKQVSDYLEDISQNRVFKEHATAIATDPSLNATQKRTQLSYLFRTIELVLLYQFFLTLFDQHQFWLFSGGRIDYFDRFVMAFQKQTELAQIINLETAIQLTPTQIKNISVNLSETFGIKVIIHQETTPHLIGGMKIKVDNIIYDYSLHTKFLQFQKAWVHSLKDTEKRIGRHVPDELILD